MEKIGKRILGKIRKNIRDEGVYDHQKLKHCAGISSGDELESRIPTWSIALPFMLPNFLPLLTCGQAREKHQPYHYADSRDN
jgi:hypothetical protein